MPGAEDEFPVTTCLHPILIKREGKRVQAPCGERTFRIVEGFPMCREHFELFSAIPSDSDEA